MRGRVEQGARPRRHADRADRQPDQRAGARGPRDEDGDDDADEDRQSPFPPSGRRRRASIRVVPAVLRARRAPSAPLPDLHSSTPATSRSTPHPRTRSARPPMPAAAAPTTSSEKIRIDEVLAEGQQRDGHRRRPGPCSPTGLAAAGGRRSPTTAAARPSPPRCRPEAPSPRPRRRGSPARDAGRPSPDGRPSRWCRSSVSLRGLAAGAPPAYGRGLAIRSDSTAMIGEPALRSAVPRSSASVNALLRVRAGCDADRDGHPSCRRRT